MKKYIYNEAQYEEILDYLAEQEELQKKSLDHLTPVVEEGNVIKIENRTGCCKYCKKADTCILSAIYPLVEKMGYKDASMKLDIYKAVEAVLDDKYQISCTASIDSCPYCITHEDSGCFGD